MMERSKAEFRAMRETLGITQQSLAARVGVKPLSVKRWESPKYEQHAPERVWILLDDLMHEHEQAVAQALAQAGERETLCYWMSAHDYADRELVLPEDPMTWTEANAAQRSAAEALRLAGVDVSWVDAYEAEHPAG